MKKIKTAVLTGGGRGTRLHPLTHTRNKHLLPLGNKPLIFHAIEKVVEVGVENIYINLNPGEPDLPEAIGDGGHWGVDITYFEQKGGPQGVAHIVEQAKKHLHGEPFIFYLSDNVILDSLQSVVNEYEHGGHDCVLTLCKVDDPERFGVPVFDENQQLIDVWEKPEQAPNNFAVTGIYIYGPDIFFEAFDNINKSDRGEYEISDIHSHFLKKDLQVGYQEITGLWKDTGKPDAFLEANRAVMDVMDLPQKRYKNIPASSEIKGKVEIGGGTVIGDNVTITGPVSIAENCELENCEIGPYVSIQQGTTIRQAKVRNTIILDNCLIDTKLHISESIIGRLTEIIDTPDSELGQQLLLGDKSQLTL